MMPRLSGLTLLRQLREDPATASLPVLVSSAYESNREVVLSLRAEWISKPWKADELLATVKRLLYSAAPGASTAA